MNSNRNSVNSIDDIDSINRGDSGHFEKEELLRAAGLSELLEWGCIAGSGSGSKKKDVVDVGVIVEETLKDVAARCRPSSAHDSAEGGGVPSPSLSPSQSKDSQDGQDYLGVNGSAGALVLFNSSYCRM